MEKPTKVTFQYGSWRGTSTQLVELARVMQAEIGRAIEMAKQRTNEAIDRQHTEWMDQYERNLRAKGGLPPNVTLPAPLQDELGRAILLAENYREQRKRENEELIKRGIRLTFGFTDSNNRRRSSKNPGFLERITNPDGVFMQGFSLASPSASISITLQNRPVVMLSLEVEGEDPDWVSSAAAPLHEILSTRESKVVKFLRNAWIRFTFGLVVWALFIPPVASLLESMKIDRLLAVVAALAPLGFVSWLYERLAQPVIITSTAPSTWRELGKVAVSVIVATVLRFVLDGLARLVPTLIR